jgi:FAD/FMN-containing dehydrogenase
VNDLMARLVAITTAVLLAGAIAGSVGDIEITDEGTALVSLELFEGTAPPRADATAAIRQQDITGDSYVALEPGDDDAALGDDVIGTRRTVVAPRFDDLLNRFNEPVRQGLKLILIELGKGLERRGADLNEAVLQLRPGLEAADEALVDEWLAHRNDTSALQALTRKGYVVDTMEIAAPWSRLSEVYAATTAALMGVPHAVVASTHLSHSYVDGACLYFTFAATPPADEIESTYVAMWDAGQRAVLASGGNLSHHHGVGLNRARFAAEALGSSFAVLQDIKRTLDPNGIMNPGKLGLPSPFGAPRWP